MVVVVLCVVALATWPLRVSASLDWSLSIPRTKYQVVVLQLGFYEGQCILMLDKDRMRTKYQVLVHFCVQVPVVARVALSQRPWGYGSTRSVCLDHIFVVALPTSRKSKMPFHTQFVALARLSC